MASIPATMYLIIGIGTVILSYITNKKTNTASLSLFIFIGAIFIIIGLIKFIQKEPKKPRQPPTTTKTPTTHNHHDKKHPKQPEYQKPHHNPSQHHTQHQINQTPKQHPDKETYQESYFLSINPNNRAEKLLLEQEIKQAKNEHMNIPPIINCPKCKKRQYKTRDHCFICNHQL